MKAAAGGISADPELRPASPKRQRLSHSPGTLPQPIKARLAASCSPWVDEFDDCDSLFPPLAPIPGMPKFRSFTAPDARQAGASGTSTHAAPHASSPASEQVRHQPHAPLALLDFAHCKAGFLTLSYPSFLAGLLVKIES